MRDTTRKRAILGMLESCDECQHLEYGTPPYTATTIAVRAGRMAGGWLKGGVATGRGSKMQISLAMMFILF